MNNRSFYNGITLSCTTRMRRDTLNSSSEQSPVSHEENWTMWVSLVIYHFTNPPHPFVIIWLMYNEPVSSQFQNKKNVGRLKCIWLSFIAYQCCVLARREGNVQRYFWERVTLVACPAFQRVGLSEARRYIGQRDGVMLSRNTKFLIYVSWRVLSGDSLTDQRTWQQKYGRSCVKLCLT